MYPLFLSLVHLPGLIEFSMELLEFDLLRALRQYLTLICREVTDVKFDLIVGVLRSLRVNHGALS